MNKKLGVLGSAILLASSMANASSDSLSETLGGQLNNTLADYAGAIAGIAVNDEDINASVDIGDVDDIILEAVNIDTEIAVNRNHFLSYHFRNMDFFKTTSAVLLKTKTDSLSLINGNLLKGIYCRYFLLCSCCRFCLIYDYFKNDGILHCALRVDQYTTVAWSCNGEVLPGTYTGFGLGGHKALKAQPVCRDLKKDNFCDVWEVRSDTLGSKFQRL